MDEMAAGNEADEAVTLSEVLSHRDSYLSEEELWALCQESCLLLEFVHNSPDMFQTLCITPDTIAFDGSGNVCFLDLDLNPESLYIPPEYDTVGNSYKSHLFSLGMTLLYAAEYNVISSGSKRVLSSDLTQLLGSMTADDYSQRPDIDEVVTKCEDNLEGKTSQQVCSVLSNICRDERYTDDGRSSILDEFYTDTESIPENSHYDGDCPSDSELVADDHFMQLNHVHLQNNENHFEHTMEVGSQSNFGMQRLSPVTFSPAKNDRNSIKESLKNIPVPRPRILPKLSVDQMIAGKMKFNNTSDLSKGSHVTPALSNQTVDTVFHDRNSVDMKDHRLNNASGSRPSVGSEVVNLNTSSCSSANESFGASNHKKGKTVSFILDELGRFFKEEELWSLCREGVLALQRKKHRLPAYVSPDTLVVKFDGSITFKSIPEDKPLEVAYMAPELQQKGMLSEKTCLYGLGVSLRCSAGKLSSSKFVSPLSRSLESLLMSMLQSNTERRPSLTAALEACNHHESICHTPSKDLCRQLYRDATLTASCCDDLNSTVLSEDVADPADQSFLTLSSATRQLLSERGMDEVIYETLLTEIAMPPKDLNRVGHPRSLSIISVFYQEKEALDQLKNVTKQASLRPKPSPGPKVSPSLTGSAFKVISNSQRSSNSSQSPDESRVPSAFSSPMTHFKPIVLQRAPSLTETKPKRRLNAHSKTQDADDTQVLQKLRELKSDLMKHKTPVSMNKEKFEDGTKEESSKVDANARQGAEKESTDKESIARESDSATSDIQGSSLETILQGLQSQGQMPQTQVLAAAIVKQLQSNIHSPSIGQNVNQPGLNIGQSNFPQMPYIQQSGMLAPGFAMQVPVANVGMTTPMHPHMIGQNVAVPMAMGPGMMSYPVQYQITQDPVTGFQQLVPVNMISFPGHPQTPVYDDPRNRSFSSSSLTPAAFELRNPSESSIGSPEHVQYLPAKPDAETDSVDHGPLSKISYVKECRLTPVRGRTAKDLIQKMANSRGKSSEFGITFVPSPEAYSKLRRSNSEHIMDNECYIDESATISDIESKRRKGSAPEINISDSSMSCEEFLNQLKKGGKPDRNVANSEAGTAKQSREREKKRRSKKSLNSSQSSSPSPSKDSGVSGLHSGVLTTHNANVSLMDRLLSGDNLVHQRKIGQVAQLIRVEFSVDGDLDNGIEDLAIAEYVSSLGGIKWETFSSAIAEKFSDLYWEIEYLASLYEIVNGIRPIITEQTITATRELLCTPTASVLSVDEPLVATDNEDDDNEELLPIERTKPELTKGALSEASSSSFSDHNHSLLAKQKLSVRAVNVTPDKISTPNKSNNRRPKSAHGQRQIVETSDSTDTEQMERRRRYKKKGHLDRSKSSSIHNILPEAGECKLSISAEDLEPREITPPMQNADDIVTKINQENIGNKTGSGETGKIPKLIQVQPNDKPNDSDCTPQKPPRYNRIKSTEIADSSNVNSPANFRNNNPFTSTPQNQSGHVSNTSCELEVDSPDFDRQFNESIEQFNESIERSANEPRDIKVHLTFDPEEGEMTESQTVKLLHSFNENNNDTSFNKSMEYREKSELSWTNHSMSVEPDLSMSNIDLSTTSFDDIINTGATTTRRGYLVYHTADLGHRMTPELKAFMDDLDQENVPFLEKRLSSLEQEIMMERKTRKKTGLFYRKLLEKTKASKGNQKNLTVKVSKDYSEMTERIRFLEICKAHLEMLLAESQGLDTSYLYSLISSDAVISLRPQLDNPTLQYQSSRDPQTSCDVLMLQGGTAEGLMSHLFAISALRSSFIHYFFYCYRYFTSSDALLSFIVGKLSTQARPLGNVAMLEKLEQRALDLLHFWLEGFYSTDFKDRTDLANKLHAFLREKSSQNERYQSLYSLLMECLQGRQLELSAGNLVDPEEDEVVQNNNNTPKKPNPVDNLKEWESIVKRQKSNSPRDCRTSLTQCIDKRYTSRNRDDVYFPHTARRLDAFAVSDYTSQCLAEQLTLIQQEMFQKTHPVHYLNSKARGISVAMTIPGTRTPSMIRVNRLSDDYDRGSLFVSSVHDLGVQVMIDHAYEISHWVASEIVNCSSTKNQLAVLSKFLYTAQFCMEMHNFATCMSILEGLENLIVRQLPIWKNLPAKCVSIMEALSATKIFLKNDTMALTQEKDFNLYPTIPCILLFLLHVQQLEIGGFRLANGLYKWQKMRSIVQVVDQIRLFKEHMFGFEPDYDLQGMLIQRIREFGGQDLQAVAAQHETNVSKISSGGIQGALRKMKGKFQLKSDK